MTLYWYVHWFWITCHCYVVFSDIVNLTTHSITEEPFKVTKIPFNDETHRAGRIIGGFFGIPPISHPANTSINSTEPLKGRKSLMKHLPIATNMTLNTTNSTTVNPPVNETVTVIDMNVTDLSLTIADNQALINTTINAINRTENLTYFEEEEEKYVNNTVISNSEFVTNDGFTGSENLSAAGITGITLGCVSIVGIILAVSYVLYRNRGFNRPQVLNDHCSNLDSSGYIDDTSVRDNSEEMYSLDNDSFLNSLEAMTIQNYWTDTVKHTKL